MADALAADGAAAAAFGSASENVVITDSVQTVSKNAVNMSLLKAGPIVLAVIGGVVVAGTLGAAALIVTVIVLTNLPSAPEPSPDVYTVNKGQTSTFSVLANDKDSRLLPLRVVDVRVDEPYAYLLGAANGMRVNVSADGERVVYTAPRHFAGTLYLNYTINNGQMDAASYVRVDVENMPPEAIDIAFTSRNGRAIPRGTLVHTARVFEERNAGGKNITDVDEDVLELLPELGRVEVLQRSGAATHGTLRVGADRRTVEYRPAAGFTGSLRVAYFVTDRNATANGTITYDVANLPPRALPDVYLRLDKNEARALDVRANDFDPNPNDDTWLEELFNVCPQGLVSLFPDPASLLEGEHPTQLFMTPSVREEALLDASTCRDSRKRTKAQCEAVRRGCGMQYRLTDGSASSTTTVFFTLNNTAPFLATRSVSVFKNSNVTQLRVEAQDADFVDEAMIDAEVALPAADAARGASARVSSVVDVTGAVSPRGGEALVDRRTFNHTLHYAPPRGFAGITSVTLYVTDGFDEVPAALAVNVVNQPPVAVGTTIECPKSGVCDIDLSAFMSDPNGDAVELDASYTPTSSRGSAQRLSATTMRFTAERGLVGVEAAEFTFRATDAPGNVDNAGAALSSNVATVKVTLVNSPPVGVADSYTVLKRSTTDLAVLLNDTDPNVGDSLFVDSVTTSLRSVTLSKQDGDTKLRYTAPNMDAASVIDSFTYVVRDDSGALSAEAVPVTITVLNARPTCSNGVATTHWRRAAAFDIFSVGASCTDADGDSLTVASAATPVQPSSQADVSVVNGGTTVRYRPTSSVTLGTHQVAIKVRDEQADGESTAQAVVAVTVTNTAPVARDVQQAAFHWRQSPSINADMEDSDSDPISVKEIVTQPLHGTAVVRGDGLGFTYTPAAGHVGDFSFTYRATDTKSDSNVATVRLTVTNAAPQAVNDAVSEHWRTALGTNLTVNVLANDNDADGDVDKSQFALLRATQASGQPSNAVSVVSNRVRVSVPATLAGGMWSSEAQRTLLANYAMTDGAAESSAQLTVTFTNANRPAASSPSREEHWRSALVANGGVTFTTIAGTTDADGDTLTLGDPSPVASPLSVAKSGLDKIVFTSSQPYKTPVGSPATVATATLSDGLDSATVTMSLRLTNAVPVFTTSPVRGSNYTFESFDKPVSYDIVGSVSDSDAADRAHLAVTRCTLRQPLTDNTSTNVTVSDDKRSCVVQSRGWEGEGVWEVEVTDGLDSVVGELRIFSTRAVSLDGASVTDSRHWRALESSPNGYTYDMTNLIQQSGTTLTVESVTQPPHGVSSVASASSFRYRFTPALSSQLRVTQRFSVALRQTPSIVHNVPVEIVAQNSPPACASNVDLGSVHWRLARDTGRSVAATALVSDSDAADAAFRTVTPRGTARSSTGSAALTAQSSNTTLLYLVDSTSALAAAGGLRLEDTFQFDGSDGIESCTGAARIELTNAAPSAVSATVRAHWRQVRRPAELAVDMLALGVLPATDSNNDPVTRTSGPSAMSSGLTLSLQAGGNGKTYALSTSSDQTADMVALLSAAESARRTTFVVSDMVAQTSNVVTFEVTNAVPTAADDTFDYNAATIIGARTTPIALNVLSNDNDLDDADRSELTIASLSTVSSQAGDVAISADKKSLLFTLTGSSFTDARTTTVRYTVTDGLQTSLQATVTITVRNNAPQAPSKTAQIQWNAVHAFDVLGAGYCADADANEAVTATVALEGSSFGALSNSGSSYTFTPRTISNAEYAASTNDDRVVQTVRYTCTDRVGASASGTVTITVINNRPTAVPVSVSVTRNAAASPVPTEVVDLFSSGRNSATDADNDAISVASATYSGSDGTLVRDGTLLRFTPTSAAMARSFTAQITYTLTDGQRVSASATVTLTYGNAAPTCSAVSRTGLAKEITHTFELRTEASVADANNDTLSYSLETASSPLAELFTLDASTGQLRLRSAARRSGTINSALIVTDTSGATARCALTLQLVNALPIASNVTRNFLRLTRERTETFDLVAMNAVSQNGDTRDQIHRMEFTAVHDWNPNLASEQVSWCCSTLGDSSCLSIVAGTPPILSYRVPANHDKRCRINFRVDDNDQDNTDAWSNWAVLSTGDPTWINEPPVAVNKLYVRDQTGRTQSGGITFVAAQYALPVSSMVLRHSEQPAVFDYDVNEDAFELDRDWTANNLCNCTGCCSASSTPPTVSTDGTVITVTMNSEACVDVVFQYRVRETARTQFVSNAARITLRPQNCVCSKPLDLVLVWDGSSSISSNQWTDMKRFGRELLQRFDRGTDKVRVGLVQFSTLVYTSLPQGWGLRYDTSSGQTGMLTDMDNLAHANAGTATRRGLGAALSMLQSASPARSGVKKTILIVTDGGANLPVHCSGGSYDCSTVNIPPRSGGGAEYCRERVQLAESTLNFNWANYRDNQNYFVSGACSNSNDRCCVAGRGDPNLSGMPGAGMPDKSLLGNLGWRHPMAFAAQSVGPAVEYLRQQGYNVVGAGIGTIGDYGEEEIKRMNADGALVLADWSNLSSLLPRIIDQSC